MKLLVEKIYDNAEEPVREHPTDSGADVFAHNFQKKYVMGMGMPQLDLSLMGEDPQPIPVEICIDKDNDPDKELQEKELVLMPLERAVIGTGIKATVGWEEERQLTTQGYEIQVRPRSGNAVKKGLTVVNTPGTVDVHYRGEICVILINVSNQPQYITKGDKIAQLVACPVIFPTVKVVEKLDDTDRGEKGFGSSGE